MGIVEASEQEEAAALAGGEVLVVALGSLLSFAGGKRERGVACSVSPDSRG